MDRKICVFKCRCVIVDVAKKMLWLRKMFLGNDVLRLKPSCKAVFLEVSQQFSFKHFPVIWSANKYRTHCHQHVFTLIIIPL